MQIKIIDELNELESSLEQEEFLLKIDEFLKRVYEFRIKYKISDFIWKDNNESYFEIPTIESMKNVMLSLIKQIEGHGDIPCASSKGFIVVRTILGNIEFFYGRNSLI